MSLKKFLAYLIFLVAVSIRLLDYMFGNSYFSYTLKPDCVSYM